MTKHIHPGRLGARRLVTLASFMLIIAGDQSLSPASAREVELVTIVRLVTRGQEAQALEMIAETAAEVGGFRPAPGDCIVFDPGLPWWVRGSVLTADLSPGDCAIPRLSRIESCAPINAELEQQVRFGQALFLDRFRSDSPVPRPSMDDVLATFIEEVAHSWQEYFYETEGRGTGDRTRQTSWEAAGKWLHGREYQVKVYVLSLVDILPDLSPAERARLLADICDPEGYANPLKHAVPSEGPPPGWPNPDGWPVRAPSPAELRQFCGGQ